MKVNVQGYHLLNKIYFISHIRHVMLGGFVRFEIIL